MKTICANCESENEINSKYCSICGFKLPISENQMAKPETEKTTMAKPKPKFNLKMGFGFFVGLILTFYLTQSLFNPSIDKKLAEIANELNKTCPMNVDQYTVLKNVVALPNKTLQYNYNLVGITKEEVKLDTLKKYVFPGILQNVKTNRGTKLFRENKVTLNYYYSDKNGAFITEYTIKPEMYEE